MIVSAHQPAYNPWLGYFHKILVCDAFVIMDDVQFEKGSFINRNKVYRQPDGLMLTIPCDTKDYKNKEIRDVQVANLIWKKKHLKTIKQIYTKAPFFDEVFTLIEHAIMQDSGFLVDYTNQLLFSVLERLDISTKIILASSLNLTQKKLDYVVELTKKLNGNTFVFGKLGEEYADVDYMQDSGIKAVFQDYHHPTYHQKELPFIPYLGVIDILFYESAQDVVDIILNNNVSKSDIL